MSQILIRAKFVNFSINRSQFLNRGTSLIIFVNFD